MRRGPVLTAVVTAVVLLVVLALGGLAFIYSGAYNIAATDAHHAPVAWALETTMERSVAARADEVPAPPALDSATIMHGFEHFHAMCVECHGAPGVEPGEFGKGLLPNPPELSEVAGDWSERELFWIAKHGIKMSGMPAFGPTHTDEQIWGIVAVVEQLPELGPEGYRALVERLGLSATAGHHGEGGAQPEGGEGHTHAPGTPPHQH